MPSQHHADKHGDKGDLHGPHLHGLGLGLGPTSPPPILSHEHGEGDADRGLDSPQAPPLAGQTSIRRPSTSVKQSPRAGEAVLRPQAKRSPVGWRVPQLSDTTAVGWKVDLTAKGEEAYSFHRTSQSGYACH